ncbi:hypothetical protein [Sphingomonas sp. 28-62-11]|uniref:hypothetical protein n=1 Tax=Sphingomonas sp. 28-62-11 TaxID=1970432 RepID=UPI000BD009CA|nr:MAG: hypothetical protein B7Y49_12985 [Sphingomonas sp. 28-62-11]
MPKKPGKPARHRHAQFPVGIGIEIIDNQLIDADVMSNPDGKAGIAFDQPFNKERLNAALESRLARVAT